eukprot:13732790-Alexandrium_andersonii.AAC.1
MRDEEWTEVDRLLLQLRPGATPERVRLWQLGESSLQATPLALKVSLPWGSVQRVEAEAPPQPPAGDHFTFLCPGPRGSACGAVQFSLSRPVPPWDRWACRTCGCTFKLSSGVCPSCRAKLYACRCQRHPKTSVQLTL